MQEKLKIVRQRYQLITFRYISDQKISESNLNRGTPGLTQPEVALSNATFP